MVFDLIFYEFLNLLIKIFTILGTLAATGVSAVELKKRERYEQTKRRKLKNPDMFVSPLRLCIHNLPRAVTDEKLKVLVFKIIINLLYRLCPFLNSFL